MGDTATKHALYGYELHVASIVLKVILLAGSAVFFVACDRSKDSSKIVETTQIYSLCQRSDDSRQRLYEQLKSFADAQQARFIDRSIGVKAELSSMGSDVLSNTGGMPVLLTVELPAQFRISATNLGLREKIALTVRSWGGLGYVSALSGFMDDLGSSWTIQKVERGVTDDPPCSILTG